MKKTHRAVLALALLSPSAAWAGTYVQKNVQATSIHQAQLTVAAGQTVVLETRNLSAGADTVIHLWDTAANLERAFNDDFTGTASRLSYTNTTGSAQSLSLVTRAYSSITGGSADIYKDNALWYQGVVVGGSRVNVPTGTQYRYETALAPIGTTDTLILGLNSTQHLMAMDDDSGVGRASRIGNRNDLAYVVVSHYPTASPGFANLYVNDYTTDGDADGLGKALEAELGTCDPANATGCTGVFNGKDTDRDALSDAAEVFGVDDPAYPQYLPRWGANPRHKDVFIELDYTAEFATNPFTATDCYDAQAFYLEGPAASLQNPDGLDGVNLHFDIGTNPTDVKLATLYGAWGGSSQVPSGTSYKTAPETYRQGVRAGLFHYGLMGPGGGGGQGWQPGDRFGWGVSVGNRYPMSMAHELGHNLNLSHHGHDSWGKVNCKPHYHSLMNYVYSYSGEGFSQGESSEVINGSFVDEEVGLGSGVYPYYLETSPFKFDVNGDKVDWNRDGTFNQSYTVWYGNDPYYVGYPRAGVTWATDVGCSALEQGHQDVTPDAPLSTTPSLVRGSDYLYAFYVGSDHRIHYRVSPLSTGLDGSCPGGDEVGDTCTTWSSEYTLNTGLNASSVSAVRWADTTIMLAYQTQNFNSIRTLYSGGYVIGTGELINWSAERWVNGAWTTLEPELELMPVNPSLNGGYGQAIALMFRNSSDTNYSWTWTISPADLFGAIRTVKDESGTTLTGSLSPSLAVRTGAYTGETCAVIPNTSSQIRFYCYNPSTDRWQNLTSQAFAGMTPATLTGKAALAYHVHRNWDGAPLTQDNAGQFYLGHVNSDTIPYVYVSETLSDSNPVANLDFGWHGMVGNDWTTLAAGTGFSLYEDLAVSALKGLWIKTVSYTRLEFLPLADGTFDAELSDGDDFQVMERGACLSFQGSSYCGQATNTVSGL